MTENIETLKKYDQVVAASLMELTEFYKDEKPLAFKLNKIDTLEEKYLITQLNLHEKLYTTTPKIYCHILGALYLKLHYKDFKFKWRFFQPKYILPYEVVLWRIADVTNTDYEIFGKIYKAYYDC